MVYHDRMVGVWGRQRGPRWVTRWLHQAKMAEQEHSNHHHFYCLYLFGEREFLSQMQTEESAYTIVLFGSSLAWESHLEPG